MLFWLMGIVRVRVYVLCLVSSCLLFSSSNCSLGIYFLHDTSIIALAASHGMNNKFQSSTGVFLCLIVRSFRSLRKDSEVIF